jgi:hypothetical protein
MNTDQQTKAVTVSTSRFNILYRGIVLGLGATTNGGPTGTRIMGNLFDNIYNEGIIFGSNLVLAINASGHNIFYDVGNHFTGSTGTPATSIISIRSDNNISISDLFERTDIFATIHPRVDLNNTVSIATTNGGQLALGTYTRESGQQSVLTDDDSAALFTISTDVTKAFTVNYTITRGTTYRTGIILVSTNGSATNLTWSDDYTENTSTGVSLSVSQTGTNVRLNYSTTNIGSNGLIRYSVTYLV